MPAYNQSTNNNNEQPFKVSELLLAKQINILKSLRPSSFNLLAVIEKARETIDLWPENRKTLEHAFGSTLYLI